MSNLVIVIVIAAVVLVLALIAAYYVMRHSRGSIKLTLPGNAYDPGTTIEGTFSMTAKKALEGKRLLVAVIGRERIEERDGNTTRTRTREIFRDERVIEEGVTYPPGHNQSYSFQLQAPGDATPGSIGGGMIGDTLELGLELLSGQDRRIEWRVEARLDASGIDLSDSQQIYLR